MSVHIQNLDIRVTVVAHADTSVPAALDQRALIENIVRAVHSRLQEDARVALVPSTHEAAVATAGGFSTAQRHWFGEQMGVWK